MYLLRLMLVGVWLGLLWASFHFFDHHVQSSGPNAFCNQSMPFAVGAASVAVVTAVRLAAAIWAQLQVVENGEAEPRVRMRGFQAILTADDRARVATSVVVCIFTADGRRRTGRRTLVFVAGVVDDGMMDGRTQETGARKAKCGQGNSVSSFS